MKCPRCQHPKSQVVKSELTPDQVQRVRVHRCCHCGTLFTSTETVDHT